jgi:hypothetical protein
VTTILDSPVVVVVPGPVQPTVIVSPPSAPTTIVQPQGPPGLPGGAPNPIVYELAAVSSWSQVHAFGYPPAVRFVDDTGTSVLCSVDYPDATHIHISFPQPFTGTVVLS